MIKFWSTTFWFLKHHNHASFMNPKVVIQNFIIELTGDKYFSSVFFMFLEFASGPCCGRHIWCYSPSKKFCQSPVESRNDKICHKNSDPTDLTPTPSQQS